MNKKFTPYKIGLILLIIFIVGLIFMILSFNEQKLFTKIIYVCCMVILLFGMIYVLLTHIEFKKDKVILNLHIYTNHTEYKSKFLKGTVLHYKDINRIEYNVFKDKTGLLNTIKIEMKDNNKTIVININGFSKTQQKQIKECFKTIFKIRDN